MVMPKSLASRIAAGPEHLDAFPSNALLPHIACGHILHTDNYRSSITGNPSKDQYSDLPNIWACGKSRLRAISYIET
jgi:hypothetical protein